MQVPFFNYPRLYTDYREDILKIFEDVGQRGAYILQKDLEEFETQLAAYVGTNYAIGVGNCTDGLQLILRALELKPEDEVIMSSHTMTATASSVKFLPAKPVLIECGADHLMDVDKIEAAITKNTKVIMPTQLNGRVVNMDRVREIADRYGLFIVEDAAQALGAKFKGQSAGSFGTAGAFSFFPAKSLGCFGDGGAITTNSPEIYQRLYYLRNHGRSKELKTETWGLNSRLDNLQAAFLSYFLSIFDKQVSIRRTLASTYNEGLAQLMEQGKVVLPPPPEENSAHFDTFQNYEIEADKREDLVAYLKENGIGTSLPWGGKAVHQFEGLGFNTSLPYTEQVFNRCLLLPLNQFMTKEDASYVIEVVKKFYSK